MWGRARAVGATRHWIRPRPHPLNLRTRQEGRGPAARGSARQDARSPAPSPGGSAASIVDEIDQHVVPEPLAVDEERPPAVEAGWALGETPVGSDWLGHIARDG